MSYRPYPSIDRARHQLERHDDETLPLPDGSGRPLTPFEEQLVASADAAREALRPQLEAIGKSLLAAFHPRPVSSEETTA